jgi:hypothetical protein
VESIAEAIAGWRDQHDRKLVLVLDQIESAIGDPGFLPSVLAFDRWAAGADVSVVLSIREDYLARLVGRTQELEPGMPIVRLPPLGLDGARAAIVGALAECRLAIEPELEAALLDDLRRAAAVLGPEMGWGGEPAVYPPHLQLACTVLFEHLGPGEATLTLAHYRSLGGFDAIVGEHLERVLDTELAGGRDAIARDLFVALVTTAHERAIRPETELVAMVGAKHGAPQVTAVLEILRSRGLLVRVRGADEPAWELVHDSLIPRVLAWIDARDLDRRRAIELVRHHLRRSTPGAPSLLDRAELRELEAHEGALAELDEEWRHRATAAEWTPRGLVARSRRALRRRVALLGITILAALGVGGLGLYRSCEQSQRATAERQWALAERERALAERERVVANIGEVDLVIEAFDWDSKAQRATVVPTPEDWRWDLRDRSAPGQERAFPAGTALRRTPRRAGAAMAEALDIRGGPASLIVERPGCAPSIVPLKLPGYNPDHVRTRLSLRLPTCAASREDMVFVPRGPFIYGGVGEPPAANTPDQVSAETTIDEPEFAIDRTEVTNAAFNVFAAMSKLTGIDPRNFPKSSTLGFAKEPKNPVPYLNWSEARAYCRFLGKELPTSQQWVKALRGGLTLPGGRPNPMPRRNLSWGEWRKPIPARIDGVGTAEVGTHPSDVSPHGVHDLVGNVEEWTLTTREPGIHVVRGANWNYGTE